MIIPFFITHAGCPHQCVFCNQKNITGKNDPPDASSITSSIDQFLAAHTGSGPVQVAFYGGSFTALHLAGQKAYLEAVRPFITSGRIKSIRLSTRPDAITYEILAMLKQYGVSIIELGAQSMDDGVLMRSGRGHTSEDTRKACGLIKAQDFTLGIQLMPGLPGDTPESFQETVTRTIALRPGFVRIYPALVIKETPLAELYLTGRYTPLSLDEAVQLCRTAMERFERAGIDVIRIGLQPTAALERPGTIIAGPWHPAFRQLVDSSRFIEKMCTLLSTGKQAGTPTFFVNPADLSSAIGQKQMNIHMIRERYGLDARILADPAVPRGTVIKDLPCNASEDAL